MKEHLASYRERNGKDHPMLADAPEFPEGLEALWSDFLELHSSRGFNGTGPARITFADLDAWQRIRGVTLQPWEIDCIRKADEGFMHSLRGKDD